MPTQINTLPKPNFGDLPADFQAHYSQLVDAVNSLAGKNGSIPLSDHLDMGGMRIMNIGAPTASTDALSSGIAEGKYSPAVLAPEFQPRGSQPLAAYRMLNSPVQREQVSSYLNDLMSSVPNANAIYPSLSASGSEVQAVIPSSLFTFADGSSILLQSRTDLLAKPASYTISTISCTGNVVTIVLTAASTFVAGQVVNVIGVTPPSFNGSWQLTSVTGGGTTLTYQLSLGTLSGSGGTVESNSVWYYTAKKRDPVVHIAGPFTADTAQNRLQVNLDANQIVAVVVITNSGGQVEQSGGGGSPITGSPTAGAFF